MDVTGFDEVWIIGETTFTHTALKYLRPLIHNGRKDENPPYLTSRYDCYWEVDYNGKTVWEQIRNSLIAIMNTRWKLPNYIIILFSNKAVVDTLHIAQHLYIPLNNLGDFINRTIFQRTSELPARALRPSDPQVLLIRTVSKSDKYQELNNFKNKRRTFNKALQKMAERNQFKSINIDDILPAKDLFEGNGNLSLVGFAIYWNFISLEVRQNDKKRLTAFEQARGPIPTRPIQEETEPRKDNIKRLRKEALSSLPYHCKRSSRDYHRDHTSSSEEEPRRKFRSERFPSPNQGRDKRKQLNQTSDVYW